MVKLLHNSVVIKQLLYSVAIKDRWYKLQKMLIYGIMMFRIYMKRMPLLVILKQYSLLMDRLHGLPKIHKALVDSLSNYRPTLSQIGCSTFKIAKCILGFISPIAKNEYTLQDSFELVTMIDKQDHNSFTSSFDIDSSFANVPLEETKNSA